MNPLNQAKDCASIQMNFFKEDMILISYLGKDILVKHKKPYSIKLSKRAVYMQFQW